jgi:hypothetical protein
MRYDWITITGYVVIIVTALVAAAMLAASLFVLN